MASNGHLENSVQFPSKGANFKGYSTVARLAGRIYVHSSVKDILLAAHKHLEEEQPDAFYEYTETGL